MHELGVVFQVMKTVENLAVENNLTEIKSVTLEINWRSFYGHRRISAKMLEMVRGEKIRAFEKYRASGGKNSCNYVLRGM